MRLLTSSPTRQVGIKSAWQTRPILFNWPRRMRKLPACVAVAGVARTKTRNSRDSHESVAVNPPARRRPAIAPLIFFVAVFPFISSAQQEESWEIQALNRIIPGLPD